MSPKVCSIEGCEKRSVCRKMCHMHYARWQRHGDPLKILNPWGTPEERFWRFVDKDTGTDCWHWTGYINKAGYGRFPVNARKGLSWQAHRFSYEMLVGPIDKGLYLLHLCDNPRCVNPEHLKPGTQKENVRDMMEKGRGNWPGLRGSKNQNSKLTEDQVREIRRSPETGTQLAKRFGIAESTVSAVRRRIRWQHID